MQKAMLEGAVKSKRSAIEPLIDMLKIRDARNKNKRTVGEKHIQMQQVATKQTYNAVIGTLIGTNLKNAYATQSSRVDDDDVLDPESPDQSPRIK